MRPDAAGLASLPDAPARWVCDVTGAALTGVTALPGGTSSFVAALDFSDGTRLVLRLHTKDRWLAHEPDIATREAHALQALTAHGVAAPALVAVDETGEFCGRPAVLMSWLPGHADFSDASQQRLRALADALRSFHRFAAPPTLPAYRPYVTAGERVVPAWSAVPWAWARAIDICAGAAPSGPLCFLHRDFHPGNVLIDGGAITGVVDWPNACAGPVEVDIAHCRINLAIAHGVEVANEFAMTAGTDSHRQAYWDLVDCLDMFCDDAPTDAPEFDGLRASFHAMGSPPLTSDLVRSRFDAYVVDVVRRYG